ncbi:extracellular solute-binding protein [Paenibacillus mesophilus]|uniref:extracellular solute-binding protein n=1 Tax=Paenibacillus mesophilus TaxID=2582849 RepID=UPI00110EEFBF|nr:extracellular solute-binding protein [Paenibacillus mesophilus]TMV48022.1 extracellular solute-binding protein [Paenibacillus mesophilus]
MKNYRAGASVVCAAILAVWAAGCSGGTAERAGTDATGKQAEAKPQEPIEIVLYGGQSNWTQEMFDALYGKAIKRKFPHITPKLIPNSDTPLEQLITTGTPFDLMLVTPSGTRRMVIDYNLHTDLTQMIQASKFDLNRFDKTIIDTQRDIAKGGLYGLPAFTQFQVLFYNRTIFDKFGVSYPKAGMTYDQLYETAVKLSRIEGGVKYYGLGTNILWQYRTSQLPVALVDPKTNKSVFDDKAKTVFENWLRFFSIPGFVGTDRMAKGSDLENMFFKDQTLAMYPHYTNVARRLPDTEILKWDVAPMPYYKEAPGVAPSVDPYYLYVMSTSKHKQAAFEVAAFLTSEEVQIELAKEGFTPAINTPEVRAAFGQNNKNYQGKNISAFFPEKFAAAPPFSPYYAIADTSIQAVFADVVTGKKDVNTALREAEATSNKRIEEQIATTGVK